MGRDVMTWLLEADPVPRERPVVAWRHDAGGGITLQLYGVTWENPRTTYLKNLQVSQTQISPLLNVSPGGLRRIGGASGVLRGSCDLGETICGPGVGCAIESRRKTKERQAL